MSSQNGNFEQNRVFPEKEGAMPFHWDGLKGEIRVDRDEYEQPETLVIIRGGEADAPATVALTRTSSELVELSLRRTLEELRLPL